MRPAAVRHWHRLQAVRHLVHASVRSCPCLAETPHALDDATEHACCSQARLIITVYAPELPMTRSARCIPRSFPAE